MGSCMSGNYGRRTSHIFADDLQCVDLLIWRRRGWLRPGCSAMGTCEIPQRSGRLLRTYAECDIEERVGVLRVRFDRLPELVTELASTPQRIGGLRWWLVCPMCNANRGKLFIERWGYWGCRECLHLRYQSQHLRPAARAKARSEQYFERAGTFIWVTAPRRPHRMHRDTFERLLARGAYFRQRWQELGVIPHDREMEKFTEKIRHRYTRLLGQEIPR